ncbi:MAG TPA: DUF5026 domain-containing protein [Ruminococcaceae bacterium]|jgi:hypothetical protein|nr:DUF5026 domain-containing protein [Oscillospiraceae bacterium]
MPLIKDNVEKIFDTASVHKGDLIRAQYSGWDEPRNGIITAVSEEKLTVLFLPGLGNVTNYFAILATEVQAGKWAVRWTTDFVTVNTEGITL